MTSKNSQTTSRKNATKKSPGLVPIGTPSASSPQHQDSRLKTDPGTLEYTDTEKNRGGLGSAGRGRGLSAGFTHRVFFRSNSSSNLRALRLVSIL